MHIYAYNNPYNNMGQIISKIIPFGIFAGQQFDDILNAYNSCNKGCYRQNNTRRKFLKGEKR